MNTPSVNLCIIVGFATVLMMMVKVAEAGDVQLTAEQGQGHIDDIDIHSDALAEHEQVEWGHAKSHTMRDDGSDQGEHDSDYDDEDHVEFDDEAEGEKENHYSGISDVTHGHWA